MNKTPNPDAPPCGCSWLDKAAKDPAFPVTFDTQMNEFHLITHEGRGHAIFYHCPYCGGRAPQSLRSTFFATVTEEEARRLFLLTRHFRDVTQVIQELGKPDSDFEISGSSTSAGSDTEPKETVVAGRRLVYGNLSATADVNVNIDRYGKLRFSFTGKYIGPAKAEQSAAGQP